MGYHIDLIYKNKKIYECHLLVTLKNYNKNEINERRNFIWRY